MGPVLAASAIALGVMGTVVGGAVGHQLDDTFSHGMPTDQLYVYQDALRKGRSIVVAMTEADTQAEQVRRLFTAFGSREH